MMSGKPHVYSPEALALAGRALGIADGKLRSALISEEMRQEMMLVLLEGVECGETDPLKLAQIAMALAGNRAGRHRE